MGAPRSGEGRSPQARGGEELPGQGRGGAPRSGEGRSPQARGGEEPPGQGRGGFMLMVSGQLPWGFLGLEHSHTRFFFIASNDGIYSFADSFTHLNVSPVPQKPLCPPNPDPAIPGRGGTCIPAGLGSVFSTYCLISRRCSKKFFFFACCKDQRVGGYFPPLMNFFPIALTGENHLFNTLEMQHSLFHSIFKVSMQY